MLKAQRLCKAKGQQISLAQVVVWSKQMQCNIMRAVCTVCFYTFYLFIFEVSGGKQEQEDKRKVENSSI